MKELISNFNSLLDIFGEFFYVYIIIFILLNLCNYIQVIRIIKFQNEINNKIKNLSIIKEDREGFIKNIVIKYIDEHFSNTDYLKLIKKQNKEIKILRKKINNINKI